jgi:YgiT-type zinc finger domain-containing protein
MIVYRACACGGSFEEHRVEVRFDRNGETILLEGVPQGRCWHCGARVYPVAALAMVEAAFKHTERPAPPSS